MSRALGITSLALAFSCLAVAAEPIPAPAPSASSLPERLSISLRQPDGHWSRAVVLPSPAGVTLQWRRAGGRDERPFELSRSYDRALLAELKKIWGSERLTTDGLPSEGLCTGRTTWTVEAPGGRTAKFCSATGAAGRVAELFDAVRSVLLGK